MVSEKHTTLGVQCIFKNFIYKLNPSFFRNSVICSKHFSFEHFEPTAEFKKRRNLKRSAIPTLFDFPAHLQPSVPKQRKPPTERYIKEDYQVQDDLASADLGPLVEASNINHVLHDHDYGLPDSKTLKACLDAALAENAKLKVKLSVANKQKHFQKNRSLNLKSTIKTIKQIGFINDNANDHLDKLLSPALQQAFNRMQNQEGNPSTALYPPELRIFASTLQFYSTKAYEYVRKTFSKALPHISTVRKWFSNLDGSPGFSEQAFNLLKQKVEKSKSANKPVLVSVMLDDMSLRKQIQYDQKQSSLNGFEDLGPAQSSVDVKPATNVLIFMAVGINMHFKIPLAYFFITGSFFLTLRTSTSVPSL